MNGKGAGGSGGCTALARLVEAKVNDLRRAALLVGKAAVRDGKLCDLREIARAGAGAQAKSAHRPESHNAGSAGPVDLLLLRRWRTFKSLGDMRGAVLRLRLRY